MSRNSVGAAAAAIAMSVLASTTALAAKGCNSVQQKCAVEIGGRCDPATGKWEYGRNGAGGNSMSFNACLSRASGKPK